MTSPSSRSKAAADDALDISVVIPVYGSEEILPELASQIQSVLDAAALRFEIIFVCDRSPDNSWQVIKQLSQQNPAVKGVLLRMNAGQHNALMAGLARARGAIIVTMDDDLQHSPSDIPSLVDQITAGHDLAYARFSSRHHPLWKILGSRLNNTIASRLMKKPTDLYLSPFRAFTAELREDILQFSGPFVYFDGVLLTLTRNIASVDVQHHGRYSGDSSYGLRKSISLWIKMATGFSIVPLRVTSILGIVTAGFGFLAAILFVIQKLTIDIMPDGWASLIVSILLIGGFQLMGIGVLGEYLGRVLLAINGRPQYVLGETVGALPVVPRSAQR